MLSAFCPDNNGPLAPSLLPVTSGVTGERRGVSPVLAAGLAANGRPGCYAQTISSSHRQIQVARKIQGRTAKGNALVDGASRAETARRGSSVEVGASGSGQVAKNPVKMVGATGIEPVTPTMSR